MFIALVGKGDFGSEGNGLDKGGKIASQKQIRRSSGNHYVLRKIKIYFKAKLPDHRSVAPAWPQVHLK